MVSFNLKVLAKFGLCSNCAQKFDGCSLARARKIVATACQMLVLAKINTLLACSQMLAKTILYPSYALHSISVPYILEVYLCASKRRPLFFSPSAKFCLLDY